MASLYSNENFPLPVVEEGTIDELIPRSGLPASVVLVALLGLEMKRLLRQLCGKVFVRNE